MHSPTIFEADIEDGTLRAGSMSVSVPEDENWRTTRVQPYVSRAFENMATSSAHGVTVLLNVMHGPSQDASMDMEPASRPFHQDYRHYKYYGAGDCGK